MFFEIGLFVVGIVGLLIGSDLIVSFSKKIGLKLGISELFIGLTIVSIGTSLPEIATSFVAGSQIALGINASGIIVGNVLGSNIANISLILGIGGLIVLITSTQKEISRDGIAMLIALAFLSLSAIDGRIDYFEGITLMLIYLIYLYVISKSVKGITSSQRLISHKFDRNNPLFDLLMIVVGLIIVIIASDFVVNSALNISNIFRINKLFIGLLIGLGTSLPELTVSITAALKKSPLLSLGNIFGSNITNSLLVVGVGAFAAKDIGITVIPHELFFTLPFTAAITIIALAFLGYQNNLTKKEAIFLLVSYMLFIGLEAMFLL